MCSNPELLQKGKDHLRKDLTKCKYPKWALDKVRKDSTGLPERSMMGHQQSPACLTNKVQNKGHIVIPYTQGLCESIKTICGRYGIQTHFKGGRTSKTYWSPQRTKTQWSSKVSIYWYQCGDLSCDDEYIGETSRTFGERYKEHLKHPLPFISTAPKLAIPLTINCFQIIRRDGTI